MNSSNSSDNGKKYVCTVCQATFSKPSSLKKHCLAKNHNAFQCSECNLIFLSKQALSHHSKAKHRENKEIKITKKKTKVVDKSPIAMKIEIADLEKRKNFLKKKSLFKQKQARLCSLIKKAPLAFGLYNQSRILNY